MAKSMKKGEDISAHNERLQEIAAMTFENLSDDEVLRFLAERKRLEELQREYEKLQKEEEERLLLEQKDAEKREEAEQKKGALMKEIERLNKSISPEKPDDELLALIAERKTLEQELENVGKDSQDAPSETAAVEPAAILEADIEGENLYVKKEAAAEKQEMSLPPETDTPEKTEEKREEPPQPNLKESLKEEFGQEGILADDLQEGGKLHHYLDQLKNSTGSLGTLLQEMPADAKRNKAFMLKVAEIDSAYAMHYADNELKKDEDFNVRIAAMKNQRNSGNPLAEMLPEARTSKVVLAAVKQDYRNIKFIQPNMEAYDEMMRIGKKVTLEKVKELKDAADLMLLIPRPLQQDKEFMAEVTKITAGKKEKKEA